MRIMKIIFAVIWAIPAFYLWNFLAPIYLPQLPPQYLDVPFWHVAGIFALITIIKMILIPHRYHRYYSCRFDKFRRFNKRHRHGMSEIYHHQ